MPLRHQMMTRAGTPKKGPTNNKLPKFHNKQHESFNDWYDDVLCILALSEWSGIYDNTLNDVVTATDDMNETLSEHLYTSLRLCLQGDAGTIMKTNENKFRKRGIEYLHSMKPIFNPQWPATLHAKKLAEFCELYRKPNMTIDQFATKFKRSLRQLRYNDIQISPTTAKHTFLQGLGSEFIPIRNMSDLPADYQTDDIDALTKASREHLARVLGNREIQRQQQRQNQTRPPTRTNPPPPPAPSPAPPSNQPPTSTETQPNAPPPSSPHQPTAAQPDFQKEIMR